MAGWHYSVGTDRGGQPRWWLYNGSGDTMAHSEAFDSESNAIRGARNFKEHAAQWRYSAFKGQDGRWYWHAQGGNNEIVASGGGFDSEEQAKARMNAVRVNGGTATDP